MKQTIIIGTAIIGLVLFAAVAFAYPRAYGGCGSAYQPEMAQIIASGTYVDLETFRESVGFKVMPWVNDEETLKNSRAVFEFTNASHLRSFKSMQDYHGAIVQARQNGYGMMGWRTWR